jgi:hypothetical protein
MIRLLKQYIACRRLNKLVSKQRQSFECEQYRRHRAAALKGRRT